MTLGAKADRIADATPSTTFLSGRLNVTSSVATEDGNRFILQLASADLGAPGAFEVGLGTSVQAGFSVPGTMGTVLYDSGVFTATAIDWSAGTGRIEGTLTGLHRAADALGVAPESSADGMVRLTVPAR